MPGAIGRPAQGRLVASHRPPDFLAGTEQEPVALYCVVSGGAVHRRCDADGSRMLAVADHIEAGTGDTVLAGDGVRVELHGAQEAGLVFDHETTNQPLVSL